MSEKIIKNNELPLYPFDSEFDVQTFELILQHCVDNDISSLKIAPSRPIEATYGDLEFELHNRDVFGFEITAVVQKILSGEDEYLTRNAGRVQSTEYVLRANGRKVAYNRITTFNNDGTFGIEIVFLRNAKIPESEVDAPFVSHFAGTHDGSVYPIEGYLEKDSFDDLLRWCGDRKASDITITPDQHVLAEIGGKLCRVTNRTVSASEIENCVRYVYGENGPAEVLAGNDLDPSHEVRVKGQRLRRYRINITPGRIVGGIGMQMTIRTLPSSPIPIENLGVEPELLKATRPTNGIIFICGPTGSGKSTLMSSIIRMIVERPDANEKVLEYSSPIEYVFDEVDMPSSTVFQTHVGRHLKPRETGESQWAYAARNSLRRKPTIIVLGEARDAETIEEAVKISQEGHLTYSTMHTNSVAETINRAINVFPHEVRDRMSIDLMGALRMIVVQILVPKVGGGKIACREFIVFDPKARERFLKTKQTAWPVLIQRLLTQSEVVGKTMLKSALELLAAGKITMETFEQIAEAGGNS
jgi:defect-in-organelle-trafficking protein DotB|nr:ATPase, T2SS/T4P/T4SS family [Neorhizobium tomejilense]